MQRSTMNTELWAMYDELEVMLEQDRISVLSNDSVHSIRTTSSVAHMEQYAQRQQSIRRTEPQRLRSSSLGNLKVNGAQTITTSSTTYLHSTNHHYHNHGGSSVTGHRSHHSLRSAASFDHGQVLFLQESTERVLREQRKRQLEFEKLMQQKPQWTSDTASAKKAESLKNAFGL